MNANLNENDRRSKRRFPTVRQQSLRYTTPFKEETEERRSFLAPARANNKCACARSWFARLLPSMLCTIYQPYLACVCALVSLEAPLRSIKSRSMLAACTASWLIWCLRFCVEVGSNVF